MQHHLLQLTFDGKLFMSPAGTDKPLHRVLDVGTGTGIWALDFGIRNPNPCPLLQRLLFADKNTRQPTSTPKPM